MHMLQDIPRGAIIEAEVGHYDLGDTGGTNCDQAVFAWDAAI